MQQMLDFHVKCQRFTDRVTQSVLGNTKPDLFCTARG